MNRIVPLLLMVTLLATGCYHARIETGLTPGAQVIDIPWAHGFIYGLVPPATVEAASECSSGVAIVETQLSFLNQLASGLTLGLYTPMHITVTCASSGMTMLQDIKPQIQVQANADDLQKRQALEAAADQAVQTQRPVYIHFE